MGAVDDVADEPDGDPRGAVRVPATMNNGPPSGLKTVAVQVKRAMRVTGIMRSIRRARKISLASARLRAEWLFCRCGTPCRRVALSVMMVTFPG